MKILIVNCNTTASITKDIVETALPYASVGTEIIGAQPNWGVTSAEGFYDSFISAAAVLDLLSNWSEPIDAVVMAGFGEHGREGARQLLDVPVVDITEASIIMASLVGHRFGIVTTLASTTGAIEQSLSSMGAMERCAGVRAAGIPVVEAALDIEATAQALAECGRELIALGADVLVLGCAGFGGLDARIEEITGVPVIDGVTAAVTLCESLVRLGKSTSKHGLYANPSPTKPRPSWPTHSQIVN